MAYPVRLEINYPQTVNRLSSAFRIILAIPIVIVLGELGASFLGASFLGASFTDDDTSWQSGSAGVTLLFVPVLLLILFRQKYPRWWFDWNLEVTRFSTRVIAYLLLLTDRYPSTDEEQSVHIEIDYPDVPRDLNRWLPLVKWLLAIPHYILLFFLGIGVIFAVILAWFAILFTGRYPRPLFDFVVGVMRWGFRVDGYTLLLVTDKYPPFSVESGAGQGDGISS